MPEKKKRIEFKLHAPEAKKVVLSGTFNNWSESTDVMKKDKGGTWNKTKQLSPSTYEYKYIVDGEWMLDPHQQSTVKNQHGSENTLIEVQ